MTRLLSDAASSTAFGLEIASACGVPFVGVAAVLLNELRAACDEIAIRKADAKRLLNKCTSLVDLFQDSYENIEGTKLVEITDATEMVVNRCIRRTRRFAELGTIKAWMRRDKIKETLQTSIDEVDAAISRLNIRSSFIQAEVAGINERQRQADRAEDRSMLVDLVAASQRGSLSHETGIKVADTLETRKAADDAEDNSVLLNILTTRTEEVAHMDPGSRDNVAAALMKAGQIAYRDAVPVNGLMDQKTAFYLGIQNLHRDTGVVPTIKVLDGEVSREGRMPLRPGTFSDVWTGRWMGNKVALKALRNIPVTDKKAAIRFTREMRIWAKLKHENILPFYGIVFDLGQNINMVSPWLEGGNVMEYIEKHPHVNRLHIMASASKGVSYLHSQNCVHGNLRCANILIKANGDACISDFGTAKIIEDVTERSATATLQEAGMSRWLAPELISCDLITPNKPCDVYSFAMAGIELFTGKVPFYPLRDTKVILDVVNKQARPERPTEGAIISDELWSLWASSWAPKAADRLKIDVVTSTYHFLEVRSRPAP